MSANEEIIPHWKGIFNIISRDEAEISRRGGKGPERGDLHLYDLQFAEECWRKKCVNALKEATFISTLGSGNSHKQRLCEAVFAEAFLNILKMQVFMPFLVSSQFVHIL